MRFHISLCLAFLFMCSVVKSQVKIDPTFPGQDDSITVTFDAAEGSRGLLNLGPPIVYMHAGVVTDKSPNLTSWRYVQGNWGTVDNKMVMTYLGDNIYQKRYHIRNFYGVPAGEKILRLAFVFRNVDGSKVGKTVAGGDIFIDIDQSKFALKILSPNWQEPLKKSRVVKEGEFIEVELATSSASHIKLFIDDTLVKQVIDDSMLSYLYPAKTAGNHTIRAEAVLGTDTISDTLYYSITPDRTQSDPRVTLSGGVEFLTPETTWFSLYAPQKTSVYLIGDFNNWMVDTAYLMNKSTDGSTFWIEVDGLTDGKEYAYQYLIDGTLAVADPFSTKVLDFWNDPYISTTTYPNLKPYPIDKTLGIVSSFVAHPKPYQWKVKDFKAPEKANLVIYELLVRDFVQAHDFQTIMDSLDYLQNLGINALELMPVSEFEGNESWGYGVSYHMALDKYYGTATAFKDLVDECHRRGIAVILDVVYNHAFGESAFAKMYWDNANNQPAANSPYLNAVAKHPFNVGFDINHESVATQHWLDKVNRYWLEEFNVDGFRFDLSKGFTQKNSGSDVGAWGKYDVSRVRLLKRMSDSIHIKKPDAILILEHFADNSEEKELGDYGFLLWGNLNHDYTEASMGYTSDLSWASYKSRGVDSPYWVVYMESHDEERMMVKNTSFGNTSGSYDTKSKRTALDRMELASCFLFGIPGPKLIWQFGELGYDVAIDFNGRTGNKPIRWNYLSESDRQDLMKIYSELIHLKTSHKAFQTNDFETNVNGFGKTILLKDDEMDVLIMGNFDVQLIDVTSNFSKTGVWYEYFTGDSIAVTNTSEKLAFEPGEYRIYTTKRLYRQYPTSSIKEHRTVSFGNGLNIFPNPSTSQFQMINKGSNAINGTLEITDISGRIVYVDADFRIAFGEQKTINHGLLAGVYLLRLTDQLGTVYGSKHIVAGE